MQSVSIPATIEAAKTALGAVGKLLTAKNWERAAIVYAFTQPPTEGRPKKLADNGQLSFTEFADLDIVGLTKRHTVAEYREAWQWAIDNGHASAVKPGDTITLPALDWPPGIIDHQRGSHGTEAEARAYITRNPQVAVEAIKAVPAVAEAVVAAVVDDHDLAEKHARMAFTKQTTGRTVDRGPATPVSTVPNYDYENRVRDAVRTINKAIEDAKAGTWNPDGMMLGLLTVFHLQLKGWVDGIAATQPAIHDEIDQFLAASRKVE